MAWVMVHMPSSPLVMAVMPQSLNEPRRASDSSTGSTLPSKSVTSTVVPPV